VSYSSFDLPKSVTTGAGTTSFLYDANHQRVLKKGPNETTVSVGGLYEQRITAQTTTDVCYVPGGDRMVAQSARRTLPSEGPPIVSYLHDDDLGSIESITGVEETYGAGSAVTYTSLPTQHFKYEPFGLRIDPNTGAPTTVASSNVAVTSGFTDQEQDDDLGLINMRGRVYDPWIARFLTTDPLTDGTSQGLNGYSYVGNNPLNFTDPSGFEEDATKPPVTCGTAIVAGSGALPNCGPAPLPPGVYTPPPQPNGTEVSLTVDGPGPGAGGGPPPITEPPPVDINGPGPAGAGPASGPLGSPGRRRPPRFKGTLATRRGPPARRLGLTILNKICCNIRLAPRCSFPEPRCWR
jgi:RHS repeat-associated protein